MAKEELPAGLRVPMSKISKQCKGLKQPEFANCQRLLSKQCMHLHQAQEASEAAFHSCLEEKAEDFPKAVPETKSE